MAHFNTANHICLKKTLNVGATKVALKQGIKLFIMKKCIWLYETLPSGETPQNNLKYISILIIFPVSPSFQLSSPRTWSALAGKRKEHISDGTFTPVATV